MKKISKISLLIFLIPLRFGNQLPSCRCEKENKKSDFSLSKTVE